MIKLLICSTSQAPYHSVLYEEIAQSLAKENGSITVAVADIHSIDKCVFDRETVRPKADNLDVVYLKIPLLSLGNHFLPSLELIKLIIDLKPDIVWCHEYPLFLWGGFIICKLLRIPVILSTEVGKSNFARLGIFQKVSRKFWGKFIDGIIARSPAAINPVEPVSENRIIKAFYAVRATEYLPSPDYATKRNSPLRLVFLGQMIPRKGLDLMFRAIKISEQAGYRFRLILIGGKNAWIQTELDKVSLSSEVEMPGFLEGEKLKAKMQEGDLFVLPSRFDTYGCVTHEAACHGLALIVSGMAGSSYLVKNGVNGFIINPEDTESFARILEKSADMEELLKLKLEARKTAEEYDVCNTASAVISFLNSIKDKAA